MKFVAVAVATFAAIAAAAPAPDQQDLYLSSGKPAPAPAPAPAPTAPVNGCVECAQYCSDPSNGNALGAACYVVKCGIKCLIG